MITFRFSIYFEPIIGGMDRAVTVIQREGSIVSVSSMQLAFYLANDKTKGLTIPENDGKVFEVEIKRTGYGVDAVLSEVTDDEY